MGEAPFGKPVEVAFFLSHRCGHCGLLGLFDPTPSEYLPGKWTEDADELFPVVYRCQSCGKPSLGMYPVSKEDDGTIGLSDRPLVVPSSKASPLNVPEYRDTAIEAYRDEAWACGYAAHRRAALVLARSALQALCRRYLPRSLWSKAGLAPEVTELEKQAGSGWKAVGEKTKRLADEWAHPGSAAARPPTAKDTRAALQFMDEVLRFTAAMERAGHLRPARWVKDSVRRA